MPASASRPPSTHARQPSCVDGIVVGSAAVEAAEQGPSSALAARRVAPQPGSTAHSVTGMNARVRVACVQAEPVIFDRDATIAKIERARTRGGGGRGRALLFPETFVPVYPTNRWVRHLAHGRLHNGLFARLLEQSVEVPGTARRRPRRDRARPRCVARRRRQRTRARHDLQLAAAVRGRTAGSRSTIASSSRRTTSGSSGVRATGAASRPWTPAPRSSAD